MLNKIAELACRFVFLPNIERVERKIGYKLVFHDIPSRFINGTMLWDMTRLWRRYGLDVEAGINYWTCGAVIDGLSTRYNRDAPEYQAWLGGYTVKLPSGNSWTPKDHLKLAVADQNSWVNTYGGPHPSTSVEGFDFVSRGPIQSGQYSGTLYETGCATHSDVGNGFNIIRGPFSPYVQAAFFNLYNEGLCMKRSMLVKRTNDNPYEKLKLRVYFALFDLGNNAYVALYGNGTLIPKKEGDINTFPIIKNDLLRAMQAGEIVKV